MKRKFKSGDISSFFGKKVRDDEKGKEMGGRCEEEEMAETPGGSQIKKATVTDEGMTECEESDAGDEEEKSSESLRETEDSGEEADLEKREKEGTESGNPPFIPAGPPGMYSIYSPFRLVQTLDVTINNILSVKSTSALKS